MFTEGCCGSIFRSSFQYWAGQGRHTLDRVLSASSIDADRNLLKLEACRAPPGGRHQAKKSSPGQIFGQKTCILRFLVKHQLLHSPILRKTSTSSWVKTCALRLSVKHAVLHTCEAQGASRAGPVTDSGGNHVKHGVLHLKLEAASFEADASFAVKHAVLHQKLNNASFCSS